jgi:hypothetical protein
MTYNLRKLFAEKEEEDFDDPDGREEAARDKCCSLKDLEKLVIMPNSNSRIAYDLLINLILLANILITSSIMAFDMHTFEFFYTFELAVDIIVAIDMFMYFFTAYSEKQNGDLGDTDLVFIRDIKMIWKNYASSYFLTDFLGVIPCLVAEILCCEVWGWSPRFLSHHFWFKCLFFTKLLRVT